MYIQFGALSEWITQQCDIFLPLDNEPSLKCWLFTCFRGIDITLRLFFPSQEDKRCCGVWGLWLLLAEWTLVCALYLQGVTIHSSTNASKQCDPEQVWQRGRSPRIVFFSELFIFFLWQNQLLKFAGSNPITAQSQIQICSFYRLLIIRGKLWVKEEKGRQTSSPRAAATAADSEGLRLRDGPFTKPTWIRLKPQRTLKIKYLVFRGLVFVHTNKIRKD